MIDFVVDLGEGTQKLLNAETALLEVCSLPSWRQQLPFTRLCTMYNTGARHISHISSFNSHNSIPPLVRSYPHFTDEETEGQTT